jgi:predicted HAD superfamily phosphohydrolase
MSDESTLVRRCRDLLYHDMSEYVAEAQRVGYEAGNTIPRVSAYLTAQSAEALETIAVRLEQVSRDAKAQADRMEEQGRKMLRMTRWVQWLTIVLGVLALVQTWAAVKQAW